MAKIEIDYSKPARTRMAPSPTGELHLGSLRTILFDYALAKKTNGQFIIRIENTDTKRTVEGSLDRLLNDLTDYGIDWDEGPRKGGPYEPYDQLARTEQGIYKKEYDRLLEEDKVYRCFCTPERLQNLRDEMKAKGVIGAMYDKHCRFLSTEQIQENLKNNLPFTIRIKMPENERIEYHDILRNKMSWNSSDVDDYILVKSNGIPTYHGAVTIDDYHMKITHVFRAAEWIPTTPVYLTLAKYLGYEAPMIIHPSVLLSPVGQGKMSKRKNGELVFARSYLDKGYPPQAILNFLMFLGWSHPDEKVNILSLEQFTKDFVLERLQPQPSRVDFEKIDWYGGQYIRMQSQDELFSNVKKWLNNIQNDELKVKAQVWNERLNQDEDKFKKVLNLLQEKIRKYSEIFDQGEFFYTKPNLENIEWEKTKHTRDEAVTLIPELKAFLQNAAENNSWSQEKWEGNIRNLAEKHEWKAGDMFMLLRLLIVGSPFSPNLLDSMNVIGVEESLERITIL